MSSLIDDFIAPPCLEDIEILYEDEYLLLINKPSGLLSLSGKNPLNRDSVHHRLVKNHPTALMAHRLDFGTSGIMLVALNKNVIKLLNQQFSGRTVKKTYTALLNGVVKNDDGIIDLPIAKDEFPLQKICHENGKPAQSYYQVVERYEASTRILYTPITGRTHQLRIHSQQFGHEILGCDLYASNAVLKMADRLMLHATSLEFMHPITQQNIQWHCPAPF